MVSASMDLALELGARRNQLYTLREQLSEKCVDKAVHGWHRV